MDEQVLDVVRRHEDARATSTRQANAMIRVEFYGLARLRAGREGPMRTGGIVLCGGRSSRMGRPKAWLPFGDEVMLQRVVRVLREVVDPVVVVAAPGQDVPELPSRCHDRPRRGRGAGPLGGLAAGLAALEGKADAAYLSSCDVPFLKPEFVAESCRSYLPAPDPLLPIPDSDP